MIEQFQEAQTIVNPLRLAGFALPFALLCTSAHAMRPASGSNCSSNWVNNEAAMQCFIQGEEETNHGTAHPHYVACLPNGELLCCVDNNHGGQDCEGVQASGRASLAQQLKAILNGQMVMMETMRQLSDQVRDLKSHTLTQPAAKP